MENEYQKAERTNVDLLARAVEQSISGAMVRNHGWIVVVSLENGSVFTLAPLTAQTVDVSGSDCFDQNHEHPGITWQACLDFLSEINSLGVEPVAENNTERDQTGKHHASEHPFGEDPLGAHERNPCEKSRSEGKRKSAIGHNYAGGSPLALNESGLPRLLYGTELFRHLKDVLPVSDEQAFIDDAGNFNVAVEPLRLRIVPRGKPLRRANFHRGEIRTKTSSTFLRGNDTVRL